MWQESNYLNFYRGQTKLIKNLTLTNGRVLRDAYVLEWKDNVKLLPDLEWSETYHYLINTPRELTKESFKAYKSMKPTNFSDSGHVQDVYYSLVKRKKGFYFIKTKLDKSE